MKIAASFLVVAACSPALYAQATVAFLADGGGRSGPYAPRGCVVSPATPSCRIQVMMRGANPSQNQGTITGVGGGRIEVVDGLFSSEVRRADLLNGGEIYGQGFAGGFANAPVVTTSGAPSGPVWPFRDGLVFPFAPAADVPGGNNSAPGSGIEDGFVSGINVFQNTGEYGHRGNPFRGGDGFITFYVVEFITSDFTPRTLTIDFSATSIISTDPITGSETTLTLDVVEPFEIVIVPAPATLALLAVPAFRRRRR